MRKTTTAAPKTSVQAVRRDIAKRSKIENPDERGEEISMEEVAKFLGLKVSTVKAMAYLREIPVYKLFRNVIFYKNEIINYRNNMLRGTK